MSARAEASDNDAPAPGGIEFRLHPLTSLPEAEEVWRGLESSGNGSFFTSWTWIGSWLACLPERIRPLLLTALAGGACIGAAVLVPREGRRLAGVVREVHFNSTGEAAFDSITIEHNGFAGAADASKALWPAFLRWFARQKDFDRLSVPGIRQGAIEADEAGATLLRREAVCPAYMCALPRNGGREEILAGLSANTRQHLRRNLRALERLGPLECERAETVEVALSWFEHLKRLHIEAWTRRRKPHAFRHPFFEEFHRALIARGVPERSVDVLRISAGGAVLGYLYSFRSGDRGIAYQSGFGEAQREERPGYISHLLAMERSAREIARHYDFLGGDNQLKRSLANQRYAMSSCTFARKTFTARLEHVARSVARKLKPWL